eukprot:2518620-Pyramimonas_sp.AAC.1
MTQGELRCARLPWVLHPSTQTQSVCECRFVLDDSFGANSPMTRGETPSTRLKIPLPSTLNAPVESLRNRLTRLRNAHAAGSC